MPKLHTHNTIAYDLSHYYIPSSIFDYEKDISLARADGSSINYIKGDGYYKPKPIVLTSTRRYDSVSVRDSDIGQAKYVTAHAKYLVFESTTIWLTAAYVTAQTTATALDVTLKLYLIPSATNYPSYTGGTIYWGYTTDYTFADTTTTFA